MDYDEIMADLSSISPHWGFVLETLYNEIGYELVEDLFKPFYGYILPEHDTQMAESYLKSIEVLAVKLSFYKNAINGADEFPEKLEKFVIEKK